MAETNFLIGRGELLTYAIKGPKRGGEKAEAYTLEEAKERLQPQIAAVSAAVDTLPAAACPEDLAVVRLAVNPSYIAKSYFPTSLLRALQLESIGSRTVHLTPAKWTKKSQPIDATTSEFFVAGKRSTFRQLGDWASHIEAGSPEARDFARIERFAEFSPADRVRSYGTPDERFFEVGLQLPSDEVGALIQSSFIAYALRSSAILHTDLSFQAGNLWFVPAEGTHEAIRKLASFAFVRVIRPAPRLRGLLPARRASSVAVSCSLPTEQPLSSEPRVAILDGGLPDQHAIGRWVRSYKVLDKGAQDDPDGLAHGLGVTSAFLFGPIAPNATASRPFAFVDHLRVLDRDADTEDPLELYRTLGFVEEVLLSRQYEFVNLSLGPNLAIEDTDVHAWTAVIDDLLSDGDTLMTVAVGNNGERDRPSGNARVQVPADCVNAVAVGACGDTASGWVRAPYSAFGPGRSPGVIKPDLLAFGGSAAGKYFHVLLPGSRPSLTPLLGTSFAAPYLLRSAVGIRAILGTELSPLAIKALLVHGADAAGHDKLEVGWGKIPEDVLDVITCPPGVARVVYKGELKPGKYLRASLPIPKTGLTGSVRLKATFCYASRVDPQDAAAYTQAGLEVVFRPNAARIEAGKDNAETKGFFQMAKFATEDERRSDLGKWETVLHGNKSMQSKSLKEPVFDIHYNAREGGAPPSGADKIQYALVITVEAPKHPDLYNEILKAYPKLLVPIRPQVSIPLRV